MVSVDAEKVAENMLCLVVLLLLLYYRGYMEGIVADEDELSVSSESVGLIGGVLVRREVGMCAGEGLSSVARCLVLGSAARSHLRQVFIVLCAAAFAHGAVRP